MHAQQRILPVGSYEHASHPSVRVVMPVHRATESLRECMHALLGVQRCGRLEILMVDDGENDDLEGSFAGYPVQVRTCDQQGSAARARNCGAAGFQGDILVFLDADVAVESSALQRLIDPIIQGLAEATVGNYSRETRGMSFAQRYKSLYLNRVYSRTTGYIRNEFWTAFGAVKTEVFLQLGGFAPSFNGCVGEDTELGQRLTAAGKRILAVPGACGRHLHELRWPDLFANDLRKGSQTFRLFLKRGSPLSDFRHCRLRDITAVALACALAVGPIVASSGFAPASLCVAVLGILSALYGLARFDLLTSFASQGGWFLVRAAWTMHLLDLTRAACVARGLTHSLSERLIASLHMPRRRGVHLPGNLPT
jgi:cellulose synthase/poly-beta-1,6-N-acetylglucosamine synthase-like glycosyltransferase